VTMRDFVQTWWPLAVPLLAVAGSTVRADALIQYQGERVNYLYENGSPKAGERLAAIEATQGRIISQLDRIERKIDKPE
jgi:hypothetical protein